MSQILQITLGMDWFRNSNKYLENLYQYTVSAYGTVNVKKDQKDQTFVDEFDFIIRNMGL